MNENRYAVGVDIGTSEVRVVIGTMPAGDNAVGADGVPQLTIVGVGAEPCQGMRKGSIVDINKVAISVDKAIGKAEQMSGLSVHEAVVSINGTHITGTSSRPTSTYLMYSMLECSTVPGKSPVNSRLLPSPMWSRGRGRLSKFRPSSSATFSYSTKHAQDTFILNVFIELRS